MDSHYKALPKLVYQTYSTSCWAAVFESWVDGIKPQRKSRPKQAELINNWDDLTFPDGSIVPSRLVDDLAPAYGMATEWISESSFTATYLAGKLSSFGQLVIGYNRGTQGGHVVVCYGVGRPKGSQQLVSVMDPSTTDGGYQNREFSKFKGITSQSSKIFIGWPKPGLNPAYF